MIIQFFRRILPPSVRRRLRRLLERIGLRHGFLRCRDKGYALLWGEGIEIGAFEHPAPVPRRCRVKYVDAISPAEAAKFFPEVDTKRLVPVDYIVDLDRDGLSLIPSASKDFVIACHVIEHLANPGRFVQECLRVIRSGGLFVIAAPDRDYTFDRARPLTLLATLQRWPASCRAS